MVEYLKREALLNRLNERWDFLQKQYGHRDHYVSGYDDCVDDVENFPVTDLVLAEEVVRCKDCKTYKTDYMCFFRKPDDFCSYGEQKDGNDG